MMEIREKTAANIENQKRSDNMKNPINSKSCIIITCPDDAQPCLSRIKLRNDAETIIQLNPGINILTVEQYPDLKYGFISDFNEDELPEDFNYPKEWDDDCRWQVTSVDMRYFDGKEVTSMEKIFAYCYFKSLKLSAAGYDNIENLSEMFLRSIIDKLELKNFDFSNVKEFAGMLDMRSVKELVIDGWHSPSYEFEDCLFDLGGRLNMSFTTPDKIIIKNCDEETTLWILNNLLAPVEGLDYNGDMQKRAENINTALKSVILADGKTVNYHETENEWWLTIE